MPPENAADLIDAAAQAVAGGDSARAEGLLRRALALAPDGATLLNLAIAVYNQKRFAEAARLFEQAMPHITVTADIAEAYAYALENSGAGDASLQVREQVLAQAADADSALNLAAALLRLGRHDVLQRRWDEWLNRYPASTALVGAAAEQALGLGDYPRGFALLRRRMEIAGPAVDDRRLLLCPPWHGEPFPGTLLVTMEPNLGEEIMLSSVLPALQGLNQPVLVEVDARLIGLFSRAWPALGFVARGSGALAAAVAAGPCRLAMPVDLVQWARRTFVLPGTPAWLAPLAGTAEARRAEYQRRWPGHRLVGISWRSARQYRGQELKSVPLTALPRTLSLPGVTFIDVQYGDHQADLDALAGAGLPVPWRDPAVDANGDIEGLAAQLCALDSLVTVSNTTAHLAGALGVPTTVLLPRQFPVLWHWGYQGEETTWYRSLRLLRELDPAHPETLDTTLAQRIAISI